MTKAEFDWSLLSDEDRAYCEGILGFFREPDLIIADAGSDAAYLYRWHTTPRDKRANTYLHIQVADDPERPLHDHPWDNFSVIISGGYEEIIQDRPWPGGYTQTIKRKPGSVVFRDAHQPHRLLLPKGTPYSISLFSTGPVIRDWGFWCENKYGQPRWLPHGECIKTSASGHSVWCGPISK